MKIRNNKLSTKLMTGAASIFMIAPMLLTGIQASAKSNTTANNPYSIRNFIVMNVPRRQQRKLINHGRRPYSTRKLRAIYTQTYSRTHVRPRSHRTVRRRVRHYSRQQISHILNRLYRNEMREAAMIQQLEHGTRVRPNAHINEGRAASQISSAQQASSQPRIPSRPKGHIDKQAMVPRYHANQPKGRLGRRAYVVHRARTSSNPPVEISPYSWQRMYAFKQERMTHYHPGIASNCRSIGNYRTISGKYVKPNRIFRSNNLSHMKANNIREMKHYGINKVIDLRNHTQIKHRPDVGGKYSNQHVNGVDYQIDPVFSNFSNNIAHHYVKAHNITDPTARSEYRYQYLLTTRRGAQRAYKNVFNQLLNNKHGAVLYHCIAGKDRTGTTTALILSALGVPKNTIIQDYLLTDLYEKPTMSLSNQYKLINTFYNTINSKYGGMHKYLNNQVGLSNGQISQLRNMYLTNTAR